MGDQQQLPWVTGSETSKAAADAGRSWAATERERVLRFLRRRGWTGATDEEIQYGLPMQPNTQRPRRVELVRAGTVEDSGRRRRTRAGRQAVVWVVAGAMSKRRVVPARKDRR